MVTENGTRFRTNTYNDHCNSVYHKECIKAEKILLLKKPTATLMPMDFILAKSQQASASRVAKLMIEVNLFSILYKTKSALYSNSK